MTTQKETSIGNFLGSNRLVMLKELDYLLFDLLDSKEPLIWDVFMKACKEKSFNFLHAFENTISFLKEIDVIKINEDGTVSRNLDSSAGRTTDEELGRLILRHTLAYLELQGLLKEIFNSHSVKTDGSDIIIYTDKIDPEFSFIKSMLLNMSIASASKKSNDQLLISNAHKSFFISKIEDGKGSEVVEKKHKFFISYAHDDETQLIKLKKHLHPLIINKTIEIWDGRSILVGTNWEAEIDRKLNESDVILFLITHNFIASDYISRVEMKKAIELQEKGQVQIVPVLLSTCSYRDLPIGKLQSIPTGGKAIDAWENENAAYTNVVEEIKKIL